MTVKQFELHRPKQYRELGEFLSKHWDDRATVEEWGLEGEIEPAYAHGCRFVARFKGLMPIWYTVQDRWVWQKDLPSFQ